MTFTVAWDSGSDWTVGCFRLPICLPCGVPSIVSWASPVPSGCSPVPPPGSSPCAPGGACCLWCPAGSPSHSHASQLKHNKAGHECAAPLGQGTSDRARWGSYTGKKHTNVFIKSALRPNSSACAAKGAGFRNSRPESEPVHQNKTNECVRVHEFTLRVRPSSQIQSTSVAGYTSSRNEYDRPHEFNVRVWPSTRVHATSSTDLTNSMYECGREHEFTQRVRPTSRIQCTSVAEYKFQVRPSSRMGFTSEAKYTSSNTEYDRAHEFNLRVWPSTRAQLHTQVAGISSVHFRHDPFLFFLHRLQTLLHFLLTQSRGKRYFRVASPAALPTEICIPTRGTGQHNQLIKR